VLILSTWNDILLNNNKINDTMIHIF